MTDGGGIEYTAIEQDTRGSRDKVDEAVCLLGGIIKTLSLSIGNPSIRGEQLLLNPQVRWCIVVIKSSLHAEKKKK